MKILLYLFSCAIILDISAQSYWTLEEMAPMPEPVTNNAVCEGFANGFAGDIPYVYSFGGIDSTLEHSGIHNKAWRYSVDTDTWESIADLPGTETTVASSASYVNGMIYIVGGYTVAANGTEVSSDKIYRYNVQNNAYETNGASIPVAIDDQVQCVYKDSLIFVVTGWSNTGNVNNVQIYDTYNDNWQVGTPVPNTSDFRVFGSNGTIIGDTLYYYGGANTLTNFPASSRIKKGYINPTDPTDISWNLDDYSIPTAYRMSCTSVNDTIYWIGGSETSYNFDADAYDGSGIVSPSNHILQYTQNAITSIDITLELPMDLRGIASISNNEKFICGGIETNAKVSSKTLKLTWKKDIIESIENPSLFSIKFQNPILKKTLVLFEKVSTIKILGINGQIIFDLEDNKQTEIDLTQLETGIYFIKLDNYRIQKILLK